MNWVDYIIIGIIALSTIIGLFRGFIKEAVSLAFWILAFYIAFVYVKPVANLMESHISNSSVRLGLAFLGLFVVVLVIGGITNAILGKLIQKTGLSGTDRMVGLIFGILRGVLLVAIIILFARVTNMTKNPWWQQSTIIPYFDGLVNWLQSLIPDSLNQYLQQQSANAAGNGGSNGGNGSGNSERSLNVPAVKEMLKNLVPKE